MSMSENKPKLVIAPGAFDAFDGTQEELQELIAELHRMVDDGTLFEQAEPVPDDEAEEILRSVASKSRRQ